MLMGEGKTMITPLVVLLLADGTRHLLGGRAGCRDGQELELLGRVLLTTMTEASQTKHGKTTM